MQSKLIPYRIVKLHRIYRNFTFNRPEINFEILHLFKHIDKSNYRPSWRRSLSSTCSLLIKDKPLSHILNQHFFLTCSLYIYPKILVPRNETEEYLYNLINIIKKNRCGPQSQLKILDLCSGSGCIAVALASNLENVSVTAVDNSLKSCRNIILNKIINTKHIKNMNSSIIVERYDVFSDDSLTKFKDYDLIISNPPYIPSNMSDKVHQNVKKFESRCALFPYTCAESGVIFHKQILQMSDSFCKHSINASKIPKIVLEIDGAHQIKSLIALMKRFGFYCFKFFNDSNSNVRSLWIY